MILSKIMSISNQFGILKDDFHIIETYVPKIGISKLSKGTFINHMDS